MEDFGALDREEELRQRSSSWPSKPQPFPSLASQVQRQTSELASTSTEYMTRVSSPNLQKDTVMTTSKKSFNKQISTNFPYGSDNPSSRFTNCVSQLSNDLPQNTMAIDLDGEPSASSKEAFRASETAGNCSSVHDVPLIDSGNGSLSSISSNCETSSNLMITTTSGTPLQCTIVSSSVGGSYLGEGGTQFYPLSQVVKSANLPQRFIPIVPRVAVLGQAENYTLPQEVSQASAACDSAYVSAPAIAVSDSDYVSTPVDATVSNSPVCNTAYASTPADTVLNSPACNPACLSSPALPAVPNSPTCNMAYASTSTAITVPNSPTCNTAYFSAPSIAALPNSPTCKTAYASTSTSVTVPNSPTCNTAYFSAPATVAAPSSPPVVNTVSALTPVVAALPNSLVCNASHVSTRPLATDRSATAKELVCTFTSTPMAPDLKSRVIHPATSKTKQLPRCLPTKKFCYENRKPQKIVQKASSQSAEQLEALYKKNPEIMSLLMSNSDEITHRSSPVAKSSPSTSSTLQAALSTPLSAPSTPLSAAGSSASTEEVVEVSETQPTRKKRVRKRRTEADAPKKQNPWGKQSYSDLIYMAINSSPTGRMKLCEIYKWFIDSVDYFKERSTPQQSQGWKVSEADSR